MNKSNATRERLLQTVMKTFNDAAYTLPATNAHHESDRLADLSTGHITLLHAIKNTSIEIELSDTGYTYWQH